MLLRVSLGVYDEMGCLVEGDFFLTIKKSHHLGFEVYVVIVQ